MGDIYSSIQTCYRAFKDRQNARKTIANQFRSFEAIPEEEKKEVIKLFKKDEDVALKRLKELVESSLLGQAMLPLRGIGHKTIACFINYMYPLSRWKSVQAIWKVAGWAPEEAYEDKNKYSHRFHAETAFNIGRILQEKESLYYKKYQAIRGKVDKNHPEWKNMKKKKGHKRTKLDNAAFQQLAQLIIKDVYLNWRKLET